MDISLKRLFAVLPISAVARGLGISRQAVHDWRRVPSERVSDLCALAEGRLRPHDLRPDLYGPKDTGPQDKAA